MVVLAFDDHKNEEARDKHDKENPFGEMREEFLGCLLLLRFKVDPLTSHSLASGRGTLIFFIRHEIPGPSGRFLRRNAGLFYNGLGRTFPVQQAIIFRSALRVGQNFVGQVDFRHHFMCIDRVFRRHVRVINAAQSMICRLYLLRCRGRTYLQNIVMAG